MNFRQIVLVSLSMFALVGPDAMAGGKLQVTKEVELNVSAADLWNLVSGFGTMQNWHPAVASTDLTGSGSAAGDKRILTLGDGAKIYETLESLDGAKMELTYVITESPLPVQNYRSSIRVAAAGDGKAKFTWTSTFDAKDAPDADAVNAITGVYQGGIDALLARFK